MLRMTLWRSSDRGCPRTMLSQGEGKCKRMVWLWLELSLWRQQDAHSGQFQPIFFKFFIPCSGNISLESITEARILNIQELVALEHAQCSATPRYSKILYFIDLATKSTWCNRDKSYDSNAYKITQFELFVVELWLAQVSASETAHFDEFHTPTNYFANSNKTTHEGRWG